MTDTQLEIHTVRGDDVVVTRVDQAGEPSTILISVSDADNSVVPTVELTMFETGLLVTYLTALATRRRT